MTPARMWAISLLGKLDLKIPQQHREHVKQIIADEFTSCQSDAIESAVSVMPAAMKELEGKEQTQKTLWQRVRSKIAS